MIVFPRSRTRAVADIAFAGLGFMIVAFMIFSEPKVELSFLFVVVGLAIAGICIYDFLHPTTLELDPRGFHLDGPFGDTYGTWTHCGAFDVRRVHKKGRMVVWEIPDGGFFGSEFGPFLLPFPDQAVGAVRPPEGMTPGRFADRYRHYKKLVAESPVGRSGSAFQQESMLRAMENAQRLLSSKEAAAFDERKQATCDGR